MRDPACDWVDKGYGSVTGTTQSLIDKLMVKIVSDKQSHSAGEPDQVHLLPRNGVQPSDRRHLPAVGTSPPTVTRFVEIGDAALSVLRAGSFSRHATPPYARVARLASGAVANAELRCRSARMEE
jgi:hypothetical protein